MEKLKEKIKNYKDVIKNKVKTEKFKLIFCYFVFPLLLIFLVDVYFKLSASSGVFGSIINTIYRSHWALFYTWLFIGTLNALLTSIFNSARKSMIIISLFFIIIMPINDFKFQIMGNPVKISDVNFLNADNTDMMVDVMDTLKGDWMIKTIIKSVVSIILFVLMIWKVGKINFKFVNKKRRIITGVITALVLLFMIFPPKPARVFILNYVFNDADKRDYRRNTTNKSVYLEYGFIQGLYYSYLGDYILPPKDYDKGKTDDIVEDRVSKVEETKDWGEPDVVFILSESFWDISQLEEYEFSKDLTSNIKRLEQTNRCLSFNMLSPSYGGASVNVEFEMLTGGSISFFNTGYIPYLQLYKNTKSSSDMPNLISEFNKNDYYTKYISSWGRSSYNSEKVFKIIGADESVYEDDLKDVVRKGNIADSYMMDVILDELKADTDKKKFLFVTTAQNHMPYEEDRYSEYDVDIVRSDLNEEFDAVARCYAQGVYDADKELGRLFDEIQKLEKPTVIVFFGDHLPYLINESGESIPDYTSYFDTGDEYLDDLRQHETQAVIVTNFDIDKDESLDMVNASYIGSYVMNKMSFNDSRYFKFIESIRKDLPVYTKDWVYKNGEFTSVSDLNDDEEQWYDDKQQVQYRFFIDNQ